MTVEEMIINIQVSAEGIKRGVSAAIEELQRLEPVKEVTLKVNSEGISGAIADIQSNTQALAEGLRQIIELLSELAARVNETAASSGGFRDFVGFTDNLFGSIDAGISIVSEVAPIISKLIKDFNFIPTAVGVAIINIQNFITAALPVIASFAAGFAPIVIAATAVVAAVGGITYAIDRSRQAQEEARQAQEALTQTVEEYNAAVEAGISEDNVKSFEAQAEAARKLAAELEQSKVKALEAAEALGFRDEKGNTDADALFRTKLRETEAALTTLGFAYDNSLTASENYENALAHLNNTHDEAITTVTSYRKEQAYSAQVEAARIARLEELARLQEEYTSGTSLLSSAYKTLADGESLSHGTVMKLIDSYPELAKHIAEGGNLTFQNGEMLKKVGAIQEEEYLKELKREASLLEVKVANAKAAAKAKIDALFSVSQFEDSTGMAAELEAMKAQEDLKKLTEEYNAKMAEINAIGKNDPFDYTPKAKGGGTAQKETDLVKERYEAERKLYEQEKALTELSTAEQIAKIKELQEKYKEHAEIWQGLSAEKYALDKQLADEWLSGQKEAISGVRDGFGFVDMDEQGALVVAYESLMSQAADKYKDFPQTRLQVEKEINAELLAESQKLADMQSNIEAEKTDARIEEQERYIQLAKSGAKLVDGKAVLSDENDENWRIAEEMKCTEEIIRINDERIAALKNREKDLTQTEYTELQDRLANRAESYQKIEDLGIQSAINVKKNNEKLADEQRKSDEKDAKDKEQRIKDEQKALEQAARDEEQRVKELIKAKADAAKEANKAYVEQIKDRYAIELKLAEDAANTEIAVYSEKIKAIDDLMKAESRAEADADDLDKIRRMESQLAFESDDANIYELQKQIAQEKAELEKRKRKESLEDEKAALQEQINAAKDSLEQRKQALQDLRDNEIRLAEESLADYIANLEEKHDAREDFAAKETAAMRKELEKQAADSQQFADKEYSIQVQAQKNRRDLFQNTTSEIIKDLNDRIKEFADAGWFSGQAFANAYRNAVSSISASIAGYYANTVPDAASYAETPEAGAINVYNTFTMPVASPSRVATEMAYSLEMMTRA